MDEDQAGITDRLLIIGVTGATNASDERKCFDAGMTDVTYKPMTRDALVGKISRWIVSTLAKSEENNALVPPGASGAVGSVGSATTKGSAAGDSERDSVQSNTEETRTSAKAASSESGETNKPVPIRKEGPMHILVVDDGAGSRTTLKALLTREKHKVEVAKNGDEALSKAAKATFDVAIINASLPGILSGCEVAHQMRVREGANADSGSPVFIIGAITSAEEHDECLSSGMNTTINKSNNKGEILQKLSSMIVLSKIPVRSAAGKPEKDESREKQSTEKAASKGRPADSNPEGAATQEAGPCAPRMVPKCPARILIVEDHWANRKLIEAMLLQKGHILDCVENGQEAVTVTNAVEYDLVLMDCNMPIMDGWQATEKIRQRRGLNVSVPIVAVTANAMKGDRDKCIQAGMDDYISKPVDRKKLYEIIAKWTMVEAPAGAPDKPSPSTAMSNSELIGETSEGRSDVSSSG